MNVYEAGLINSTSFSVVPSTRVTQTRKQIMTMQEQEYVIPDIFLPSCFHSSPPLAHYGMA